MDECIPRKVLTLFRRVDECIKKVLTLSRKMDEHNAYVDLKSVGVMRPWWWGTRSSTGRATTSSACRQRLTLVHFSAQSEPFLTHEHPLMPLYTP